MENFLPNDKTTNSTINDEEFKRKVRALIRSREQLKLQNNELIKKLQEQTTKVKGLEQRIDHLTDPHKPVKVAAVNDGIGNNAIYRTENNEKIDYISDDKDIKLNIGKVFLDAQASAQRIVDQSKLEAEITAQRMLDDALERINTMNLENELSTKIIMEKVQESKDELDAVKIGLEGIINSFSGRVDVINGILQNIEQRYNN